MKKKYIVLLVGIIIVIAVLVYQTGTTVNTKAIPVYESTTDYPELTLDSLTDMASYILLAEVKEIGEPIQEEISESVTEKHSEKAEVHNFLVTPVVLKVQKAIKGSVIDKEFIYYEEGGVTPDYIQLPDGYTLEEGMEIILFLNREGYCWGAGSMFPVVGNKIILNETARDYFDEKDVSVWDTQDLISDYTSQINSQSVSLVSLENFVEVIQRIIEQ